MQAKTARGGKRTTLANAKELRDRFVAEWGALSQQEQHEYRIRAAHATCRSHEEQSSVSCRDTNRCWGMSSHDIPLSLEAACAALKLGDVGASTTMGFRRMTQ